MHETWDPAISTKVLRNVRIAVFRNGKASSNTMALDDWPEPELYFLNVFTSR